jgi:hypothetical protein
VQLNRRGLPVAERRRELRIGRIDFLHFSGADFKFEHVGDAHGANGLDFIAADIRMSLDQLSSFFDRRRAGDEIARRWYVRVDHPKQPSLRIFAGSRVSHEAVAQWLWGMTSA